MSWSGLSLVYMKTVNIHQAKTHLSRLIEEVTSGEEVVIARAGKPLVRLVAIAGGEGVRKLGALKGKVVERDDAWAPDPEIEWAFYGGEEEMQRSARVAERSHKTRNAPTRKKK